MSLSAIANTWIERDPDPETRAELEALVAAGNESELAARFAGPLEFGTAGLRGVVAGGESRMNLAVVCIATAAVLDVLQEKVPDLKTRGIVIGHDARNKSDAFAQAAAKICAFAGVKTWLYGPGLPEQVVPTPLVAFASKHRNAAAAIMVTASHNPPKDNGYKVYWGNGAQIVPPVDEWIRVAMEKRAAQGAKAILDPALRAVPHTGPSEDVASYVSHVLALRKQPSLSLRDLKVAYTPMHGVGGRLIAHIFDLAGISGLASVADQFVPDGRFPTVAFPNPEEPGAMDRLLALAKAIHADVALANDPDADRLAVAVKEGAGHRVLTGNEVGALLGAYLLDQDKSPSKALVGASIVSSPELSQLAKACGAQYLQTLTGFKWIANSAMAREAADPSLRFIFGFEEALGYTVGTLVRDKDGISAALIFCEMVAWLKTKNQSVLDYQREIAKRVGVYASAQRTLALSGNVKEAVHKIMAPLRASPPKEVDGDPVEKVIDYLPGGELPSTDMISLHFKSGARMLVRPSGTEPKVKIYCDVRMPFAEDILAARSAGVARAKTMCAKFA